MSNNWKRFAWSMVVSVALMLSGSLGHRVGEKAGIDSYHKQCYNFGGFIIRDEKVVYCQPLGTISKEEQQQFDEVKKQLDKLNNT